jgi:hypothetical protein
MARDDAICFEFTQLPRQHPLGGIGHQARQFHKAPLLL